MNGNVKSFSNETLNFFFRKFWIGLGWIGMLYFVLRNYRKKSQMNKMHNTSSISYQSIRLIKVNVKNNNNDNNNSNNK